MQGQTHDAAHLGRNGQPETRKREVDEEQLDEQRRITEEFHVHAGKLSEHRDAEMHDTGHDQADDDGADNTQPSDAERQYHRLRVERQVFEHHTEVHKAPFL